MDRETALRKVLRCLRLAASSNAHESAAALRQARALMDQYGLTEADAYATEIHEADAATRRRIRKRANKDARGEQFAIGWVSAVSRLFPKAELPAGRRAAIDAKLQAQHDELEMRGGRTIGKPDASSWRDRDAGYAAGSCARVNAGIGEDAQRKLEHSA